jgi:hypothetical protein
MNVVIGYTDHLKISSLSAALSSSVTVRHDSVFLLFQQWKRGETRFLKRGKKEK